MKKYITNALVIILVLICMSVYPDVKADAFFNNDEYYNLSRAEDHFYLQQYDECIKYSNIVLMSDNSNIAALYFKGKSLFYLKRYDEAAVDLDKVLALDPMHAGALCDRGLIYAVNQNTEKAKDYLTKAVSINPWYSDEASIFLQPWNNPAWDDFSPVDVTQIYLDGELLCLDIRYDMEHGRTLAPVRGLLEALGAKVQWDNDTKTVTAIKDNNSFSMQINNSIAKINNQEHVLDSPATLYEGKTYIPIRFAAEAFGAKVESFNSGSLIYIATPGTTNAMTQEEQDKIISRLDKALDYEIISGAYINPNSISQNEAILNIISSNSDDLSAFQSLSNDNKKKLMFAYVNNNPNEFAGCKTVNVFFVFDNQKYARMEVNTQSNYSEHPIYIFKNGMDANIVVQDISKNTYYFYYGTRPAIARIDSSSDWVMKEIEFDKQHVYTMYCPKQWTVQTEEGVITIVPPSKDDIIHGLVQLVLKKITDEEAQNIDQAGGYLDINEYYIRNKLTDGNVLNAEWVPEDKFCAKDYSGVSEYLLDYTYKDNNGINIRECSRFFINENGINLYCNLISENNNYYFQYKPLFNMMINSLKMKNVNNK